MPCHTRMKRIMQGLLWLSLLEFGFLMVMSLEPGYLDFDNLPDTNFSCVGKVIGGYYADLETNCQMFHVCTIGQLDEPMDIRFLCLNGTVFDQETRVCERIDEVDCSKSEQFYSLNLELYGNTQPPIVEEDFPVEIKRSSSTTTTTTSTTQRPSHPKSSSQSYYTTSVPPPTTRTATKVITSHHFPVVSSPDIRFNPEEINISLNPGAPPDITRSQAPISFQQQSYSNSEKNTRVTVTTHTTIYKNDKPHRVPLLPTAHTPSQILVERPKAEETTQAPKSLVSYGLTHSQVLQAATPTEINYGFTYQQTEESVDYNTEVPPHPYQYQINIANLRPPTAQDHHFHSSYQTTSKRPHKVNFPVPTTYRNHPAYTSVRTSSSQQFHSQRTERPPRLQLPLPLLPTLPPLTFSSPAPFSLGRHIETKRYTNDHHHQSPPRIIISASASVSDNSGRRLNYSLGTIGASHLLGPSPATYDEYKEDDVGLDPFYHDVPKIKSLRHKRSTLGEDDVIKNDQEAADLLRFLFNWYSKREKMRKISIPVTSEDITEINEELAPIVEASTSTEEEYSNLFDKTNIQKTEHNLEPASVKREIELKTTIHENNELEELVKMLESLNITTTSDAPKEEKKHSEVVELSRQGTLLNETESSSTTKKPKQGRNHRRRTGKSSTTPRRNKKPRSHRKTNHGRSSNTTHTNESLRDELHLNVAQGSEAKNVRRNSSRSGRTRKTNSPINLEISKPIEFLDDVNRNENEIKVKQPIDMKNDEYLNATTVSVDSELNHTTVRNKLGLLEEEVGRSTTNYDNIQQKDLLKIYKLLGEPGPSSSFPKNSEYVETHESKQLEHVITTHIILEVVEPTNSSSENVTVEKDVNSDNKNLFENATPDSTTQEIPTTETSENDKHENLEHSTELVLKNTEKSQQDDEVTITTTDDPDYVSTTLQHNYENLQAQPSSYRNEEDPSPEEDPHPAEDPHPEEYDKTEANEVPPQGNEELDNASENTDKPVHRFDYGDYENETEPDSNAETPSEHNNKEIYLQRTEKTLEEQELEEATLHIDLLNSEINEENESTNSNSEAPDKAEINEADKITEDSVIDTTISQPKSDKVQEDEEEEEEKHTRIKNKNIALTPRHKSHERILLPQLRYLNRDDVELSTSDKNSGAEQDEEIKNRAPKRGSHNFKTANRRTYEAASSEEELPNSSKLSAISSYKSRSEEQKRRNNYIRSRKFIANPSSSKNAETSKSQYKTNPETHEKGNLKEETPVISDIAITDHEEDQEVQIREKNSSTEENPIIPDYVDDNYEPLTYHEPSKEDQPTHRDQDLEETTVTDKLEQLNGLEHSTGFNEVSDLHDHTSLRSNEEEGNTTIFDASGHTQEETVETTPTTQEDEVIGTTEGYYESLTEATATLGSQELLTTESYLKYAEELTTEQHITHLTTQTNEITIAPTTTELVETTEHLESTMEPLTTTTAPETTTNSVISSEYVQTTNANTESTIDLVQGPVFTTDYPAELSTIHLETTQATSVAPSSTSDSSGRVTSLTEPDVLVDLTTPLGEGTTNKYQNLKTRLPWYKRQDNSRRKEHARHRFSTNSRRTGVRERIKLDNKITHVLNNLNRSSSNSYSSADKLLVDRNRNVNNNNTAKLSDIESVGNSNTANTDTSSSNNTVEVKHNLAETKIEQPHSPEVVTLKPLDVTKVEHNLEEIKIEHHLPEVIRVVSPEVTTFKPAESIETTVTPEEQQPTTVPSELEQSTSGEVKVDIPVTAAPLLKSANPTKAKYTKIVFTTTPLSKFVRVELRKDMHGRKYSFNCFNKKIHQFYSDARDCRLFHYCTLGYSKNQMVDMKFVCDAGTYFDDEKLICTKVKPARCL